MYRHSLDKPIHILVEIALTGDCDRSSTIGLQERTGRQLGLTGAEMDAARAGTGFDVKSAAAVHLALAARSHDKSAIAMARGRALDVGFGESDLTEIERLAKTL